MARIVMYQAEKRLWGYEGEGYVEEVDIAN